MSRQSHTYSHKRLVRQLSMLENQYASLFAEEASLEKLAGVYKKIVALKEKIRQVKNTGNDLNPS